MGKRSEFPRIAQDAYSTPEKAVAPLLEHLQAGTRFIEPCAGAGRLIGYLEDAGHMCVARYNLPDDARTRLYGLEPGEIFISNPPWRRDVMHQIIVNLSNQAPTWLLIDAGWVHTQQSIPFLPRLRAIVSVGRVRWIPGSRFDAKDSCAWHLFDRVLIGWKITTQFIGRADFIQRAPCHHIRPPICLRGFPAARGLMWLLRGQDRLLQDANH